MIEQRYIATGAWKTLKSQGRTIRWLAEQVGVPENTLTKYKRGHRKTLPRAVATRISTVLGVPLDLLFLPVELPQRNDLLQERSESITDAAD
jgi:transcriptional regulator with XRE-family HTH domain